MKHTIITLALTALSASAVTTSFSGFGPGNQTILANSSGVAAAGLTWGILVDLGSTGFDLTDNASSFSSGIDLNTDGFIGEDFFIVGGSELADGMGRTIGPFPATGTADSIQYDLVAPLSGGESFAILFADGSTIDAGGIFGLTEALAVTPTTNSDSTPETAFQRAAPHLQEFVLTGEPIPEPSSAALLGLAGLALVARRKR